MNFDPQATPLLMPKREGWSPSRDRGAAASSPMRRGAYGSNVNHARSTAALGKRAMRSPSTYYEPQMLRLWHVTASRVKRARSPRSHRSRMFRAAYQNLESVELGVTSIDHYFDTLGGISRAVRRARASGESCRSISAIRPPESGNTVRTLADQVALETRTRMLNPKWYESMLEHGYEGVRQIESHVTNTMGWSATTGKVAPWVYQQISDTFVLDEEMRRRLASLNPAASVKVANRLLEAHERQYWSPDPETLAALERAGEELEDALEGITEVAAA